MPKLLHYHSVPTVILHLFIFFSPSDHIAQMFFLTSSLVEGNQFLTDGGIGQQQWIHLQKGSLPDDKPKAKKGN